MARDGVAAAALPLAPRLLPDAGWGDAPVAQAGAERCRQLGRGCGVTDGPFTPILTVT